MTETLSIADGMAGIVGMLAVSGSGTGLSRRCDVAVPIAGADAGSWFVVAGTLDAVTTFNGAAAATLLDTVAVLGAETSLAAADAAAFDAAMTLDAAATSLVGTTVDALVGAATLDAASGIGAANAPLSATHANRSKQRLNKAMLFISERPSFF